jgi:translation initiation factor 2B subunit (eIF-2B alpha/beta/delta family)
MDKKNDDIQELLNKIKNLNNKEEIEVLIEKLQNLIEQQQDSNSVYLNQLKEEVRRLSSL